MTDKIDRIEFREFMRNATADFFALHSGGSEMTLYKWCIEFESFLLDDEDVLASR
jgi:hypothetical protein